MTIDPYMIRNADAQRTVTLGFLMEVLENISADYTRFGEGIGTPLDLLLLVRDHAMEEAGL
jgi:hypothetical protein